ncbi:MAG: hypothetical protein IKC81_04660 [Paludibacteraceae bacterium]|nr:hypothetical protein [Paludibacteraceae bacterium]
MANQTFSIRLSDEYINIFNKLHEQANEANPISKSAFFEKVLDFFANPKVKEVEVIRDSDETTALVATQAEYIQKLETELEQSNSKRNEQTQFADSLQQENASLQTEITVLHERLQAEVDRTVTDLMKEFPAQLLILTAERLSAKYKRAIKPIDILQDMFLRYTIERWNKWFYDWVLTDDEIVKEAQKINPAITSIKQLKNFVIK